MILQLGAVGQITEGIMTAVQDYSRRTGGEPFPVSLIKRGQPGFQRCGVLPVHVSIARIGSDKSVKNGIDHQRSVGKIEPDMRVHPFMVVDMTILMAVIMLIRGNASPLVDPLSG